MKKNISLGYGDEYIFVLFYKSLILMKNNISLRWIWIYLCLILQINHSDEEEWISGENDQLRCKFLFPKNSIFIPTMIYGHTQPKCSYSLQDNSCPYHIHLHHLYLKGNIPLTITIILTKYTIIFINYLGWLQLSPFRLTPAKPITKYINYLD